MFRNITTLVLASAAMIAPAAVFAGGNNPPVHPPIHANAASTNKGAVTTTTVTKISTPTLKTELTLSTSTKTVVAAAKTFPMSSKLPGPKVSAAAALKFAKKNFDPQYNLKFGTKFDKGYYYSGKHHNHWSYRCWYADFGCYCYWDPCLCTWFYFCEPDDCFYPIAYCPYQVYHWPGVYVVDSIPVVSAD